MGARKSATFPFLTGNILFGKICSLNMQNSMVVLNFSVLNSKYLFLEFGSGGREGGEIWSQYSKLFVSGDIWHEISVLDMKYPFFGKFSPKNQNYQFKIKFSIWNNSNMQNYFFCFRLTP